MSIVANGTGWFALAQSIVTLIGSVVLVIGGPLLALYLKKQAAQTERIHTLVNSNMGIQKWSNVLLTRQLATLTNKPEDIFAAEKALEDFTTHQAQQKIVDNGNQ